MVHATRSSVALQSQQTTSEQVHPHTKKQNKKRKRASVATDLDSQRVTKQPRVEPKKEVEEPGTGDLPLNQQDAAKILDVLEMIDTQGLLDRVFPLPDPDSSSPSKASTSKEMIKMHSLRSLLKDSAVHPLRVLRSAIQPLFPISSHPRSRPSVPAMQQIHFCNLALSLLDQSSKNQSAFSLAESTLFPDSEPDSTAAGASEQRRRYALVQKLPTGEWWTSSNTAREGEHCLTATEAKEMKKGQAELVSIIPTPPLPASTLSTLGELQMEGRREPRNRFKPLHMTPRPLSAGTFLDYGPYASFAPPFDSEGAEVGREGLGHMLIGRLDRRKVREARRRLAMRLGSEQTDNVHMKGATMVSTPRKQQGAAEIDDLLSNLFPGENIDGFKTALQQLEVEEGVTSLLKKDARALERLSLLQTARLRSGVSSVEQNSEEWKTAQEIMNSLALLVSMRPRPSTSCLESENPHGPLVPPPAVLRTLHSTLPTGPSDGWQGTLDETRKTALRDDTTVHVKAGAVQASTATSTQYRAASAYPYQALNSATPTRQPAQTPAQASYYPNAYLQSGATSATPNAYQYQGQYSYPPATWYGYQQQGQKGGAAAIPYYSNYLPQAAVAGTTTTPRAVGNTAKPPQGQNGWAHGYGQTQGHNQTTTTLPPHLRRTTPAASTPGYAPYHAYVPPAQTPGL